MFVGHHVLPRWRQSAPPAVLLLGLILLTACESQQQAAKPDLPKLGELEPATTTSASPVGEAGTRRAPRRLIVERLLYDRADARVDLALGALDAAPMDESIAAAWAANGFGLGVVDEDRLPLFIANLPRNLGRTNIVVAPTSDYAPLTLVGHVPGGHAVRVAEAGDARPIARQFIGGQYQLLMKLQPPDADDATHDNDGDGDGDNDGETDAPEHIDPGPGAWRVDLLPHHFGPRQSLVPRTPQEKVLDGTSFTQLRIEQALRPGRVWVLWGRIDREALRRRGVSESNADPGAPPPSVEQIAMDQAAGPPPPPLLGEAMTTGRRGSQHVRLILLMRLAE